MKILVLSQYYPPENTLMAPTIAHDLISKGHQVRVLTGYPNYPEGSLFDGFKQHWRWYERDGAVDVLRVPLYVDHSQRAVHRSLNYLSFGASAATARGFARGADVVYIYATQMTPALGPWLWRLTGGAPYVLHVQDLWPDSITGSSLVQGGRAIGVVNSLLNPWLRSTYRQAAAVIGIAPTMVGALIERGVPKERVHLVYNWAKEDGIGHGSSASGSGDKTNVIYAGNVGDMQDLETAVHAAWLARDAKVALTVVGDGVALPRVRALVDQLGATNVSFQGRVPRDQMGAIYSGSDYALVTLKDLPAFRGTIPSKFQASLSHGLPVITTVQGDVRALVEELHVGFTADAEDADSLAAAFRVAATEGHDERAKRAACAREAYETRFSRALGTNAIEQILMAAARGDSRVCKEEPHATA